MANKSSGSSGPGSGSRRGRRAPTIDLSAEEVKRAGAAEPAAGDEAAAAAPEEATAEAEERAAPAGADRPETDRRERREAEPQPVMPSAFATRAAETAGPADEPPARGRGAVGLLAAALAGGLIVLVGLVLLDRIGLLPIGDRGAETAALRGQVAALEQELAAARQAAELEGEDLQAQLADLNARVAALAEAPPADGAPAELAPPDPALAEELSALQAALAELRDALGTASAPAALEEVGERLERLERLEGLPERVAELAERVQAVQAAPGDGLAAAVETEVATLADRLGGMEEALAQLAEQVESAPSAEALESVGRQLSGELQDAEARLQAALDEAGDRLGGLSRQLAGVQAAVAATALADALAAGRPFAAELRAMDAAGFDDAALAELEPHAEAGLPDRPALSRRFAEIAPQLAASDAPPPDDAGPLERLLQSARNVVEVRPAGPRPGDSAGAVASRIEAALAAGDLAGALEEWQDLPPDAQTVSQDWAEAARAVVAGEAAAARLRGAALARLAEGS